MFLNALEIGYEENQIYYTIMLLLHGWSLLIFEAAAQTSPPQRWLPVSLQNNDRGRWWFAKVHLTHKDPTTQCGRKNSKREKEKKGGRERLGGKGGLSWGSCLVQPPVQGAPPLEELEVSSGSLTPPTSFRIHSPLGRVALLFRGRSLSSLVALKCKPTTSSKI